MNLKLAIALISASTIGVSDAQGQTTLEWQGFKWNVRSAKAEGPGPNLWNPKNVWIDNHGYLHMKISKSEGVWSCAEIWMDHPLGFGTYQCQVEGRIDKLDPNIVFSMFSYAGPDGTKEIDIEYAKWGNPKEKNSWWTVYPNDTIGKKESTGFELKLDGNFSTSRYLWTKQGVHYWMLGGLQPLDSHKQEIKDWDYLPKDSAHAITQKPIPLHFNLWLFQGKTPINDEPVEMVIRSFSFKPQ